MKVNHIKKIGKKIGKTIIKIKNNWWTLNALLVLFGAPIGGFVAFLGSKGCFDKEAIDQKYAYYYNPNDTIENRKYSNARVADYKEDSEKIHSYYTKLLAGDYDSAYWYLNRIDDFEIPKGKSVNILNYNKDSSIAKIRVYTDRKRRGYMSTITLHDTLKN